MSAVLVSLIAVAGTLLGSLTTYLFQRQTARHTEATARAERLRQDRRVACGDFIAAVTEVERAVINDNRLRQLSDDLIAEPDTLRQATDGNDLKTREATFATKRAAFIAAARSHIG